MALGSSWVGKVLKAGGLVAGSAVGASAAAVAWSRFFVDHEVELPDAIDVPRRTMTASGAGEISYYVDDVGPGRPVVLLHSVNAAASAFEMRPLFEAFRGSRPLVAPDLPGFGFSERSERPYRPELYRDALLALLGRFAVPGGADVVALSLSAEHAAMAAVHSPELVHSLVMISPTGFASPARTPAVERLAREGQAADDQRLGLRSDLLEQTGYDLLTTRTSIRFFLRRSIAGDVPEDMVQYAWRTSHRPGARRAPFAFLRGQLFVRDVGALYAQVSVPTLVLFDEDAYSDYALLPGFVLEHPSWAAQRIAGTCGLPQVDAPLATARAIRNWHEAAEEKRPLRLI